LHFEKVFAILQLRTITPWLKFENAKSII